VDPPCFASQRVDGCAPEAHLGAPRKVIERDNIGALDLPHG
jgi:hypothetical protein